MSVTSRGYSALRAALVVVCIALFAAGCVTTRQKADEAFEAGQYGASLHLYQQAFEEERVRDPEAYYRAARAAVHAGKFSDVERYYTLALRHGGGVEVAKSLADFYVKTSNYASAVRVYQFLLDRQEDVQPIYNNLGTALMYAGSPFDAESYLMVAQQMEPENPLPYLNLGILYDRHLRQPWLAINFYECFIELGGEVKRIQLVKQRIQELRGNWTRLYEPKALRCGESYQPTEQTTVVELKGGSRDEGPTSDAPTSEEADGETPSRAEEIFSAESEDGSEESATSRPVVIEEMVDSIPDSESGAQRRESEPPEVDGDRLAKAAAAFESEEYAQVVDVLEEVPAGKLEVRHLKMLGTSLVRLDRKRDALPWLNMAESRQADPEIVKLLIELYDDLEEKKNLAAICRKYDERAGYEDALEGCPRGMTAEDYERLKTIQEAERER